MTITAPALDLLRAARREGYALAALNAVNMETAQAAVRAAEAEGAPVILQFSQNAARYAGLPMLAALGRELRACAAVPVILHFDHAESPDVAWQAVEAGFDGVMLESDDPAVLAPLAERLHAAGAYLEAEYEVTEKGERQATQHQDLAQLAQFARDSRCDLLAVALGSVHKQAQKTTRLDLERLEAIAAQTPLPLVLHGASGVVEADLEVAARCGLSKVNVATELTTAFSEAALEVFQTGARDPRRALGAGREAYQARARAVIRLLGASGKARALR
ncbi:class II fructose-bisphosphate aldolase [Deinococcus metallilatus]|uniref:Ketose-bisphosphate aldolase n=1 Tax=Deinococcus metallilatus TaxID=1211322 RepID=A0ABR6MNJ9_9DEIO|nr:class II fructose-bisphosphate aldolase [Deinococcus metallilatus]MBB5293521.1 ketose-bisphosphate aldolase [Deinococcus metallilatus]GMA15259.1 fructose-bisphosphate aldolase [Deinococcus metallilatus]